MKIEKVVMHGGQVNILLSKADGGPMELDVNNIDHVDFGSGRAVVGHKDGSEDIVLTGEAAAELRRILETKGFARLIKKEMTKPTSS